MPKMFRNAKGFTLIELLIVIVIISILTLLTFVSFSQVQRNARDAQRKSDLQTVAGVLQRWYSDFARYPLSNSGRVSINSAAGSCQLDTGTSSVTWGTGSVVCGSENYSRALPSDPLPSNPQYCYIRTPTDQRFELYARLEGSGTTGTYTNPTGCSGTYNYLVTAID